MYVPAHFAESRIHALHGIIRQYPLGALVTSGAAGLDANHLPFDLDASAGPYGRLLAHVARANALWQESHDGDAVLVIFAAADAYISPNWYPSKHEQHRQVPTWNYQVVHVHGRLRIRDDEKFVRGVVGRLTRTHEAAAGGARPWKMADSAPDFIDQMVRAIVGLEVEIDRIVGKAKLGQNRDERDRLGAADELATRGKAEVSDAMRRIGAPGPDQAR